MDFRYLISDFPRIHHFRRNGSIGAHFGFDTGIRSFPYVALWAKDKKTLEENLASIRKISAKVIDALELPANKPVGVVQ